ncbi:Seleno_W_rel-domain-containing protein [Sphaerulina musiva SO2202]|uniref:Seleno_W_rel-domain-containing protein n=1 Tax=Sphaerulina musiva (strain SO2202) TaxID=692275 RepID=N1QMA2_SPHMS|nr:Seleno_W_rel-domain-containing protein [Sphaerulina musiva SO2202]EMF17442.1 Seleno_W_rel-domain-containing protein [Sphaerulina musiva SO2202]
MSSRLPKISITFCTQCKWMLRATYYAQELFSTFGPTIGEIALIPATGGIFTVDLTYKPTQAQLEMGDDPDEAKDVVLWDRKTEGGFPETKILKQRVRNYIEPEKKLGHSDTPANKVKNSDDHDDHDEPEVQQKGTAEVCEDCK